MTLQADRDAIIAAAECEISGLFRPLTRSTRDAVTRHAAESMTPLARVFILRDVDQALDAVFGRYPGDPSAALTEVVTRRARQGWARVFEQQVADVARRLRNQPEVAAAIRRDAARGS